MITAGKLVKGGLFVLAAATHSDIFLIGLMAQSPACVQRCTSPSL